MTAQATCPGAGADAHLCVGRHAELPNSERCQVKNTSVFKDKIPGSPWNSVHSISWGSGAGVTPPALFQGSGFLPPLFNESCSQTPNQPLRAGVGGPLPLAGWGSVFLGREASRRVPRPARAERHVGRPPGRWHSGQWQLVPAVGKPFPPGPGGQGAAGPGWPCEFHRDCPRCALGLLLVSCVSFPRGSVPWAGRGLRARALGPGQACHHASAAGEGSSFAAPGSPAILLWHLTLPLSTAS